MRDLIGDVAVEDARQRRDALDQVAVDEKMHAAAAPDALAHARTSLQRPGHAQSPSPR
jgi:hypothetical protein